MAKEKNRNKELMSFRLEEGIACCELLRDHLSESDFTLNETQLKIIKIKIYDTAKKSFFFFAKYVLEFDLLTYETHKVWCDNLQDILYKKFRIMRLKPRATYKSTIYGIAFILWVWACISQKIRIFYTSSNALLIEEVSDKLSRFLSDPNTVFQIVFNVRRDDQGKFAPKNTGDVFNIEGRSGKGFSLILRTAGGSTVGIHPNLIIVDDPMDKTDRESQAVRTKKENWFDTLTPLVVPFYLEDGLKIEHILFIATRWHPRDLVNHIMKRNKDTKTDEKWDIEVESLTDGHGNSNYPEFIDKKKIEELKSSISDIFFALQYENNPLPEGARVFKEEFMSFVRPSQVNLSEGQIVCFLDPSKGKEASDWPAVIWVHFHNQRVTVIEAFDKEKFELSLLIQLVANRNKLLGVSRLVFEDNGTTLVKENLKEVHAKIGHYIHIQGVYHSSNKQERIITIQPDLYNGFVQFYDDWKDRYPQMMEQILYYPTAEYDDFPDVLEMAISHFKRSSFEFIRYEGCL